MVVANHSNSVSHLNNYKCIKTFWRDTIADISKLARLKKKPYKILGE